MDDIKRLHEEILYPVVRVRTEKGGGSGTIIYSKPNPEKTEEYLSFVLTNHHVIAECITIKDEFDSVLKRDVKKEVFERPWVDIFDYHDLSTIISSNTHTADIVAYDNTHDLALLKLDSPKPMLHVAKIKNREEGKKIKNFTPIYSCGASKLHEPFANPGHVTYLQEIIDNKVYWMSNANSIFGNSGGAVFLAETGEFIGVPARISAIQLGFSVDIITWMGFFVPITRVYEFFDEQELKFLYDSKFTYKGCMEKRKKRMKRGLIDSLIEGSKGDERKAEETETA